MRSLDTVMNSLELAVHQNTTDDETMAAIRAFRRMAGSTTVSEFCLDWYGKQDGKGRRAIDKKNAEIEKLRARLEDAEHRIEMYHQKLDTKIESATEEVPVIKSARTMPMLCTDVVRARFGNSTWDNPGWNELRREIVVMLIRDGVPIKKLNESISTVCCGRVAGYLYITEHDISLKTRNATEICKELYNLARSLGISLDVEFHWQNKGARANGKAGGRHAEGAAIPGATGRITWDNPPDA